MIEQDGLVAPGSRAGAVDHPDARQRDDGRIDGNEKIGSVQLNGQGAAFQLPTVFVDPTMALEAFAADLTWKSASVKTMPAWHFKYFTANESSGVVGNAEKR